MTVIFLIIWAYNSYPDLGFNDLPDITWWGIALGISFCCDILFFGESK
jgi:hypothetical protein